MALRLDGPQLSSSALSGGIRTSSQQKKRLILFGPRSYRLWWLDRELAGLPGEIPVGQGGASQTPPPSLRNEQDILKGPGLESYAAPPAGTLPGPSAFAAQAPFVRVSAQTSAAYRAVAPDPSPDEPAELAGPVGGCWTWNTEASPPG